MGKRKLTVFFRKYVSNGLSRVTTKIAGTLRNSEGQENPTTLAQQTTNSQAEDGQRSLPNSAIPVTRVPALDTIDQYVVGEAIEGHIERSPRLELSYRSDTRDVIDNLIRGYARFISSFTGRDDVAFILSRHPPFVLDPQQSRCIISATTNQARDNTALEASRNCLLHEIDIEYYNEGEVQFCAELGLTPCSKNGQENVSNSQETMFTLLVEPDTKNCTLQISFTYPRRFIPDIAVNQLLKILAAELTGSCSIITLSTPTPPPELSVLNFPPLMVPPSRHTSPDGDMETNLAKPHLLHAAFEDWTQKHPNAVALDFVHSLPSITSHSEHSILTYAALNEAASNLAVCIRSLMSSKGKVVEYGRIIPVHMSTSPELYISYLGILKAGCAFCPIPHDAPLQRVQEIIQDIDSPILLGNTPEPPTGLSVSETKLGKTRIPTWVNVTEVSKWKDLRGESLNTTLATNDSLRKLDIEDHQTAYLLFTSGSTGRPKGVQISHLAGTCSIESHIATIPLPGGPTEQFRWFQFASPSFDPSIMEIFVTLGSGATLCSADHNLTLTNLEGTINEARASVMMATPSLAALLRPSYLTTLQSLWSMGEKLNRTVIENFAQKPESNGPSLFPTFSPSLVNAYGPTEGAINCTFSAPFAYQTRGSIIGEPLPTCAIFILALDSRVPTAVPSGLVGELAIGGPQVSNGYFNNPDETKKAFVHSDEFGYIYRTGDKARIVWNETGSQVIEYLGRITTDQVKMNGRRVELGEIESVVSTVPGVREVVAVVLKGDDSLDGGDQITVCLVVDSLCQEARQRIVQQAKRNAKEHLIPSMNPSRYTFMNELPRSSAGKVDRKAVTARVLQRESNGPEFAPDVNPEQLELSGNGWEKTEDETVLSIRELVIRMIAESTGGSISAVNPEDDLYSLGMDSLTSMKFLQKLRDHSIDCLSVGDVLQSQTPKALVSVIENSLADGGAKLNETKRKPSNDKELELAIASFGDRNRLICTKRFELTTDIIQSVLPATATQCGMLASFLRSSSEKSFTTRNYIYHSVLPLKSQVDIERMKSAWDVVISNYDSLRTVFCWVDDDMAPFAQCILAEGAIPQPDWTTYFASPGEEESALHEALRTAQESIDLSSPPWKISLITSSKDSQLVLSMFHGIFDGGSLELLLEDVASVYTGEPLVQRTSLGYIVKHHFQSDQISTSQFWDNHLKNYAPVTFPSLTSYRLSPIETVGCVEITSLISHEILKKRSKNIGSTPLSVLQAAWSSILLCYIGTPDQDVVMGSVVSGRLDEDSAACIGPTFTIIPMRVCLNDIKKANGGALTNAAVVRQLALSSAAALSHLQRSLGSMSSSSGQTPYDTVLAYQDFPSKSRTSDSWGSVMHPPMASDFTVMVEVVPAADLSLTFRATYNAKLDAASAELMLKEMDDIISFIFDEPNGKFEDAPFRARSILASSFNPAPIADQKVREGSLLHSQFEEHARTNPDNLALIFKRDVENEDNPDNVTFTYSELNAVADKLAEYLLQLCGPLANASVPICIEKSPELYVAILGILKAGGAWCPIDTLSPAQRRHDLIARTSAGVLLVSDNDDEQLKAVIPAGTKVVDVNWVLKNTLRSAENLRRSFTTHRATPDTMAYLIWTSGTTGAPKGVPITHSAAVSSMRSLQASIPANADGSPVRCLQFSQYTFDVSIQDLFYTWGLGGVIISATRDIMLESFAELANVTYATHAHLTPAFAASVPRKRCKTLKVITMIGEKLTQQVADDWGTDMRAFNTYGPAEVAVVSTIREFGNEHKLVKSANVGWPMESVSVFVTKNQRVLMKNAIGELALGGPQLSPGYLNQDDITKAKYIWNEEASQKLYYTGDLVRMLADGSLEYITRVDDLVKIGGIRVELSEISFALRGCHPLVETIETLILSRPDRPTQVLVAFLSAPGAAVEAHIGQLLLQQGVAVEVARAAANQARDTLPDHMIPSVYLVVKTIPKTPSAKVDRRALQAAYASVDLTTWENEINPEDTNGLQKFEISIRDPMSTTIIEIIAALVNISPSVVANANRLRSLGVDSIRATRLASRLKEAGYKLSVMEVLTCITVHDLIKLAASLGAASITTSSVFDVNTFNEVWHGEVTEKVKDDFVTVPATPIQESLLTETMSTYDMYWSNHFFSLDDAVDVSRLRQAWFTVCQKTEALRTGFIPVAEIRKSNPKNNPGFSLLQLVYKLPTLDWEYHQVSQERWKEVLDSRIEDIMTRNQKNYFRHPPWAITLFDKGSERVMMFTLHHSIHDEPSLRFIMDDVRSAYTYKPPQRRQLSDALSIILADEDRDRDAIRFWTSELASFTELDAPVWPDLTGMRVRPGATSDYQLISEEIPSTETVAKLQSTAARLGLQSVASIVRVAWAYVSLSYLGLPATVFAETLSDRVLDSSLEHSIGPLISVVPIPFNPNGSAREVLIEQQRLSAQSWKYRHIHAREIRKVLKRSRGEPLYPAVFNFHGLNEDPNSSHPDLWRETQDLVGLHVEHPMAMNVFQRQNGSLILEVSSNNRIISRDHLRLFVRQVDGLISSILKSPDEPLARLVNNLSPQLRSISNQFISKEVKNSIHNAPTYWLEWYAKRQPDWTAVEVANSITAKGIEKRTMSYGLLNSEANRVAAFISSLGHKNRVIAVCTGRTLASYPLIIGIFKSGNTYLPIDEGLPVERKGFLIEDSNCPVVFTESSLLESFSCAPNGCRLLCVDDPKLSKSFATMPADDNDYMSQHDDNAYLLFTSGSTGKPKGVMVTRGNLSSFIESFSEFTCQVAPRTLELGGKGRYLAQANRAFDPHLLEMLFPWRHGMATATAPRTMILDDLGLTISKWDITHASFVPSLVDQSNITPEQCPSLIYMTVGGEKITQKVLDTWASAPQVAIVNAYGPTEVTIGCTFAHVKKDTNLRNIGPPLTACTGHVLIPGTMDYALRGQTGELCFTGDLVAKGYLNRPDATGFIMGPSGEKMYRTGDIGRLMADDSVEYLGRGDDQTKIRGQRLELGEVSEVLRSSSTIDIAVVTTVAKHPGLSKVQLISFIARLDSQQRGKKQNSPADILYSDFSTLGRELQDICRKKLPAYMVPELILPITSIPVAQLSGKANMKDLHALYAGLPLSAVLQGNSSTAVNGAHGTRPLSPDEKAVVNEICKVVSADSHSFGPMTNIFEIGLDSLSAIGLSVRLRDLGYEATVARVMSNPAIEQLARLPRNSSSSTTQVLSLELHRKLRDLEIQYRQETISSAVVAPNTISVRPCLPLQEGLVARSINSDLDQLYVNHVALQLDENIDVSKLKSAWQAATDNNEIMRTTFSPLEKEIVQVILPTSSCQIQWTKREHFTLDEAIDKMKSQQTEISRSIITEISSLPPVRFQLAMSTTKCPLALFISIHHALYDGESFPMLLEEVAWRYEGEKIPQRGSPSAFINHIYLQDTARAKQYWIQSMSGCRPTSFRSNTNAVERPIVVQQNLGSPLSELESRSAILQTTVPVLIQAIFALLLADTVGSSDVTYGIVLSGRTISVPDAASVLLPCITTIPGRLDTRNLHTVGDAVEAVQKFNVRSLEFQHTSLRHIQRWLKIEKPIFDCLFSYVRAPTQSYHKLWRELDFQMPSEYPLALEVEANHTTDTIRLNCIYSRSFGSSHDGKEFLEKMNAVLSSIVSGENPSLENFNFSQSKIPSLQTLTTQWENTTWSSTETHIQEITRTFCGLASAHVTKGASFLSLGIDSVTAIQFAHSLRQAGLHASSSDIMRFSCVGALAKHIDEASFTVQANGVKESKTATLSVDTFGSHIRLLSDNDSVSSIFECTPLQSGMITQTISSNGKVYVHPHLVRLNQSVDINRLKAALHQVIKQNDILRTSFHVIKDIGPFWVGAVHTNPPFEWTELTLASDADLISEATSVVMFNEETSFEIPPIHVVVVSQPEGKVLVVIMHHALYDGASLPFVFEDLAMIYNSESSAPRPQFSDIVGNLVHGQEESCKFWIDTLRGYQPIEIPKLSEPEFTRHMLLSERMINLGLPRISDSCKEMEVTIQTIALLTYAKVFAHLIGRRDVVFGQVLAGRSLSAFDADRTMGPLFNTVTQRVRFDPNFLSNRALALRLQQHSNNAQIHQHAPLRVIQNTLRQTDGFDSTSLFDSLFVFQKSAALTPSDADTRDIWSPFEAEPYVAQAEYKLNIEVDHAQHGVVIRATCDNQYLSQRMLDAFLNDFNTTFCDIIEHPARCATALPDGLGELPLKQDTIQSQPPSGEDSGEPLYESIIRSVLAEVAEISIDNITPGTSVFSIGLDSLSAIRIASLCRAKGMKISVGDILQGKTLRGISQRIQPNPNQLPSTQGPLIENYDLLEMKVLEKLHLVKESVETILPCLPGQFYHIASWLKSGRKVLEPAWSFFSSERIDNDKLQKAWFKLCQRHPVLRTCFTATSSTELVQIIMREASRDMTETFKVIESSEPIAVVAKAQAHEEALNPSSLFTPPVRLRLLKASDRDGIVIVINHAVYDAWTMPIFISELGKLYRDQPLDSNPDFPSFVDFSTRSLHGLNEKAYWTSALNPGQPTFIKTTQDSCAKISSQLFVGAWETVKNLSQMELACRSASLSLQAVVLLAVARCLAKLTRVNNPIMGLYQSGRSAPFNNIEKLSGPCLNVNPFLVQNVISAKNGSRGNTIAQALEVQASLAERVSYEQSALLNVLQWTNTQSPGAPLFNTWINLLWMKNNLPSSNDASPESDLNEDDALFQPLRIGVPTDFIPNEPLPDLSTSVDALDTSFLPDENVFIDIAPDVNTDTIGFGVRVEGGAITGDEVHRLVAEIGQEIEEIVSELV